MAEPKPMNALVPKLVAEAVGTLALCYVGILAIHFNGSLLSVALAHGLTIAVFASALMLVSGGQFNPAVTFGLWVARQMKGKEAGAYVLAQLVGAIVGSLLASLSVPNSTALVANGTPTLGNGVAVGTGLLVEAILTFFLVFVICGTGVDPRFGARIGGLAIGLTVTLDILAGGAITGAAMNPARWLGPAIVSSHWANALVYLVGPLAGGALAALLYVKVVMPKPAT